MDEVRYMISDASKTLQVEPHVLRYWEEELDLAIPRNEMGHRFYRQYDIDTFLFVKKLKEENFHLRTIRLLLPNMEQIINFDKDQLRKLRYEMEAGSVPQSNAFAAAHAVVPTHFQSNTEMSNTNKMEQFKEILGRIVSDALYNVQGTMSQDISKTVSEHMSKELDYRMREKEESDEKRYRSLDETLRNIQKARKETSIVSEMSPTKSKKRHKNGRFQRKN